jgi:hypothetical protein
VGASHRYSEPVYGYRISPYLQERMTYLGQSEVYQDATELIDKFLHIEVNAMQIHRVTNTHGSSASDWVDESCASEMKTPMDSSEVVYAQFDGSMLFTRESGWQEVKIGRLFTQSDVLEVSTKRTEISKSLYVTHLGDKTQFLKKWEPLTDTLEPLNSRLVFITDGAVWMRQWMTESYPNATIILDFYHALEHVNTWLGTYERSETARTELRNHYKTLFLTQGGSAVLEAIQDLNGGTKTEQKERMKLLNYLRTNEFRMDYPRYLARELYIGSGAIESAQRTVVQQRLKLSGQRWSQTGAQNVLNLRAVRLSGQWHKVVLRLQNYQN